MISINLLLWIIALAVGVLHLSLWIITDRSLNWIFMGSILVYAAALAMLYDLSYLEFAMLSIVFLVFNGLYVYDRQFIHKNVTRKRR